jgi:hypothetical protein
MTALGRHRGDRSRESPGQRERPGEKEATMAKRRRTARATPAPGVVLLGDVRPAPIEVEERGQTFHPDVALWIQPDTGLLVGQSLAPPGHAAETLLAALEQPVPVPGAAPVTPRELVVFNQSLADELRALLGPRPITVTVSPPVPEFDAIFDELFAHLRREDQAGSRLDLPDEVLPPLLAAMTQLWRAKPWDYLYDTPPLALVPATAGRAPLYASVLGANGEVLGVALYVSLQDYETTLREGLNATVAPPEDGAVASMALLMALHDRSYLASFDPRDDLRLSYRDQLARFGWSRRFSVVPTFGAIGGNQPPGELTADEAVATTWAVSALATFCQRHQPALAREEFPIADRVEVSLPGETFTVDVQIPPPQARTFLRLLRP